MGITFHFPFPCFQPFETAEHSLDAACVLGLVLGQILFRSVKESVSPFGGVFLSAFLIDFLVGMQKGINDGGQNRTGHILVNMSLDKRNHVLQGFVELLSYLLRHFLRVLVAGDIAIPIDGVYVHRC